LVLVLPLILYLIFPTKNFYWDGVSFAIAIENPANSLLWPSHLLYAVFGAGLYKLSGAIGFHTRALFILQTANSVLAGACLILLYRIVRRAGGPRAWATIAALTLGFSATWWKFATDANAYIPAVALLLGAYLLLDHPDRGWLAGLAHAAAMLFHELAILFLPIALLRLGKNRRARAVYLLASLAPVGAAYWIAYRSLSTHASVAGFWSWTTSHSPDSSFSFRFWSNLTLSLRGTFRLFFGGKLIEAVNGTWARLALIALVYVTGAFLYFTWRSRKSLRLAPPPLPLIAWVGVYVAFLFFWMPQNTFYRLFYLPPLIAMVALALSKTADFRRPAGFFAVALFVWNFAFLIYPQSQAGYNVPLRFAMEQHNRWPPGTRIVFHYFDPDLWTISYFNPQGAWIGIDHADLTQLENDLAAARSKQQPLWLDSSAYDLIHLDQRGRDWLSLHERSGEQIRFHDSKHDFRFYCLR
jgi:hypothetical protein